MSGHTPGPWTAAPHTGKEYGVLDLCSHAVMSANRMQVATVVSDCVGEFKANAALIAAAPELLEALRTLADYPLEEFGMEGKPDGHNLVGANDWQLTAGHIRAARAAIAKATQP